MRRVRLLLLLLLTLLPAASTRAGESLELKLEKMELTVEVPRLNVSEYHRPYVALWIQDAKGEVAVNLAVWFQVKGPEPEFGNKWLPDLRQWWRRSGRKLESKLDAISAPTPPPGERTVKFTDKQLANLAPGSYTLLVESVREVGGRELLEIPFTWPAPAGAPAVYKAQGKDELGHVTLKVNP
jgi:hypothetical protein